MCICVTSVTSVTSQTSQTYIKLEVCNESTVCATDVSLQSVMSQKCNRHDQSVTSVTDRSRGTMCRYMHMSCVWACSSMHEQARASLSTTCAWTPSSIPAPGSLLAPRGFGWGETGEVEVQAARIPGFQDSRIPGGPIHIFK